MVGSEIPNGMRVWRYNDALCAFDSDINSLLVCSTNGLVKFVLEGYNSKYAAQNGSKRMGTRARTIDDDLFKGDNIVVYLDEGAYCKPKRYFLVGKNGEFKFEETAFEYIKKYPNYFLVKVNGKYGWLDANLTWIIVPAYEKVIYQGKTRNYGGVYPSHVRVKAGKKWGLLDKESLLSILPCIYISIELEWECDWDLRYNSVPAFWKCKRKDNGNYDLLIIEYKLGVNTAIYLINLPFNNLATVAWEARDMKAENWMNEEGSVCYLYTSDYLMYGVKISSNSLVPELKFIGGPK